VARKRYLVGLDLGQVRDFTAVAILYRDVGAPHDRMPPVYAVPHLARFPLGTTYPEIVEQVRRMLTRPPLYDGLTSLVVDATGVGRPVVDLFRSMFPSGVAPVTITSGSAVTQDPTGYWHVPKKELVSSLQVLLQGRRLKIANALREARVLVRELENFRVKVTASAHETFEAWREGDHDDLVFAVALAAWAGEQSLAQEREPADDEPAYTRVVVR
jgi:hypothetical protein